MKPLKPEHPSKHHYFQLSRDFNAHGLKYLSYRELLRYWDKYEKIEKLGTFDKKLIQLKKE